MRVEVVPPARKLSAHAVAELLFWTAMALIGLYIAWRGSFFGGQIGYSAVGPAAFPVGIGVCLFLICGGVAAGVYRRHAPAPDEPIAWKPFLIVIGLFGIYLLALGHIGFLVATPLFYAAAARTLGSRRVWLDLVAGVVLTGVIFACFRYGLGVRMPTSEFWHSLLGVRI